MKSRSLSRCPFAALCLISGRQELDSAARACAMSTDRAGSKASWNTPPLALSCRTFLAACTDARPLARAVVAVASSACSASVRGHARFLA